MSGETKKLFETMKESEAFDLLSREGKWGGGYCTELSEYKLPFILSNFNGSSGDVDVLTHEFGHALAAFKSFDVNCGAAWAARQGTMETCEVHSMSMEYFAHRWMELFSVKRQTYTAGSILPSRSAFCLTAQSWIIFSRRFTIITI